MSAPAPAAPARAALPYWACALAVLAALALTAGGLLPHAKFEPDDYRYLWLLRQVDEGAPGALARAVVVENRWDEHWWIADGTLVRFFRPLVILSYGIDRALFGVEATGFVVMNVAMHALVALVALALLRRLLEPGWAALLAAVVFAVQTCHMEQLYFVAARTETLGGLFFLGGMLLFLRGRERPGAFGIAGPVAAYLGALLCKESSLLMPLAFLALDRWVPDRGVPGDSNSEATAGAPWLALVRRRAGLYAALAGVLVAYFAARALVLEGGAGTRPYPYFFLPGRDGFALRTLAIWLQYCASLVAGMPLTLFLTDFAALREQVPWPVIALGAAAVPALLAFGVRSPTGRLFAALFLVLLVPMLPLYSSGRYVYVPAFAWAGLVGLAGAALARRGRWLALAWAVLVVAPQVVLHRRAIDALPAGDDPNNPAELAVRLVREGELDLRSDAPIYLIDAPMRWLSMQFLQSMVEMRIEPAAPPIRVLVRSARTPQQGLAEVRVVDDHTIEVGRPNGLLYEPDPIFDFDQRAVRAGDVIRELGYEVTVLEVRGAHAQRIRVRFERPLAELQLAVCLPAPGTWQVRRLSATGR